MAIKNYIFLASTFLFVSLPVSAQDFGVPSKSWSGDAAIVVAQAPSSARSLPDLGGSAREETASGPWTTVMFTVIGVVATYYLIRNSNSEHGISSTQSGI
jgi:hypothetical protein